MNKTVQASYVTASQPGGVPPTVTGPDRGTKEVMIVGGSVLILAIGLGIFWMGTQGDDVRTTNGPMTMTAIPASSPSSMIASTPLEMEASATPPALPTQLKESRHADVYFEFGRNRVSDEAKVYLGAHADFLKKDVDWGVIIQGYTDDRGSSTYNKRLGLQRAEAVRNILSDLGIPETSMQVVSLGEEGTLCRDDSSDCRQINRRVHLEFIKVGATHLVPPAPIQATSPDVLPLEISETETGNQEGHAVADSHETTETLTQSPALQQSEGTDDEK